MEDNIHFSYSQHIHQHLHEFGARRWQSWSWSVNNFKDEITNLRNEKNPGQSIWKTRRKQVFKSTLNNQIVVAYKTGVPKKFQDKIRISETLKEMLALKILEKLGFPVIKLLAGGEVREHGMLKEYWMVSQFETQYTSGVDFCALDSKLSQNKKLRIKFIKTNMEQLAKLHRLHWIHGSFTPYNILFKADDNFQCCYLDVGHCRPANFSWEWRNGALNDLYQFFWQFICPAQDIYDGFNHYFAHDPQVLSIDHPKVKKLLKTLTERP